MIRVLLSAPLCLHIRLSSRFPCWPEMWIVPPHHWGGYREYCQDVCDRGAQARHGYNRENAIWQYCLMLGYPEQTSRLGGAHHL